MRRAVPLILLAALGACVHSTPSRVVPLTDECFDERDRLRDQAEKASDPRLAGKLDALEARCRARAAILIAQARKHFDAAEDTRGRALLDRALALASQGSDEYEHAYEMREGGIGEIEPDYLTEAREAEATEDWITARESYRTAIEIGQDAPDVRSGLARARAACLRSAAQAISEARAYEAALNFQEALYSVERAFEYFEDSGSREYVEAEQLQARLEKAVERDEDDGIDDPPEEEVLDAAGAEDAEHRLEWIAARNAYRLLGEEQPDNALIREALRRTQEECLVVARREILMAKAFESARNLTEAAKMLVSALRCADAPHLPEYSEARRLLEGIRSQNLPSPSLLTLPSGRDELVKFGDARSTAQDWLTAREAYRRAADAAPGDPDVLARVDSAQSECLRHARRFISEAKAYEAAANYPEALKAAREAQLYADSPGTKENQLAVELERRIHVEMTYP